MGSLCAMCVKDTIRCIFLSDFHPVHGSKIRVQVPEGFISKEVFDAVNVYIIPKPKTLQRCILTVNTLQYKIIGYPVRIDSDRYKRNAYYFNLCFVVDDWAKSVPYEQVVKKLAEYFTLMEEEEFLSQVDDNHDKILRILESTLRDLNANGVTTIVEGEITIHLKIIRNPEDPPPVLDHQVPQLRIEFADIPLEAWDLTTQHVLPHIDGINHVARIATESDVESTLVKCCIQNLVYYNAVVLLPLIKYSNVYMCSRNLQNLVRNPKLFAECQEYVALTGTASVAGQGECHHENADEKINENRELAMPSLHKIFQIFSFMTHGQTLKNLCQRLNPREHNIDERRLVAFGLRHNLIRTINKFPIFVGSVPVGRQHMYNGLYSLDEICCKTGMSPSRIEQDLQDNNVIVIWK